MSDLMQQMLDAIHFHEIAREEARRTILCEPEREHAVRAAVDQHDAADIFTVKPSPFCQPGQLLVIDEGALEAQRREWLQGLGKGPL